MKERTLTTRLQADDQVRHGRLRIVNAETLGKGGHEKARVVMVRRQGGERRKGLGNKRHYAEKKESCILHEAIGLEKAESSGVEGRLGNGCHPKINPGWGIKGC